MKIEIVSMFTETETKISYLLIYSPCLPLLVFLLRFVKHALFRSRERSRDRSEMYLYSHSSRSEFVCRSGQLGPAGGMTSDRSGHFPSRSHVNIQHVNIGHVNIALQYSININTVEVDPHSDLLHICTANPRIFTPLPQRIYTEVQLPIKALTSLATWQQP